MCLRVINYIPVAQVPDARAARAFSFLKGRLCKTRKPLQLTISGKFLAPLELKCVKQNNKPGFS